MTCPKPSGTMKCVTQRPVSDVCRSLLRDRLGDVPRGRDSTVVCARRGLASSARRTWFCVLMVLVTSPAFAQLPDPVANEIIPSPTTGITHGPLLGKVTPTSVRLWIRTVEPTDFEVVVTEHLPFTDENPVFTGSTTAGDDNTGFADITSLKPNTRYRYGVRMDGQLADIRVDFHDPWPAFRTLPDGSTTHDPQFNPAGRFNVKFGIGHCASQAPTTSGGQYGSTPAYDTMLREHGDEIQFALVNGDVIYEAERDGTLEGVRSNHRLYQARGRSFARLFRNVPALFTYDDHDVGWDIHGSGQIGLGAGRHLMRDVGLTAYEEYLSWANYDGPQRGRIRLGRGTVDGDILTDPSADFTTLDPARVSTIHLGAYTRGETNPRKVDNAPKSSGVYGLVEVLDANRLRIRPPAKKSAELNYSVGTHHYYDWKIDNCHFFALDTRGERTLLNPKNRADEKLYALGSAQKKWLLDGIANTDAQFIFLISPDPWMIYHTAAHVRPDDPAALTDDKGDGFPSFLHERAELLDFLDDVQKPVLIFTGDVHASASVKISDNVWEMMCGPLGSTGHPLATLGNPPSGGTFQSYDRDVLFRWVSPFPNNVRYERLRNTYYAVVQVNNVLKVAAPSGSKPQFMAYDAPTVTVRWHDGYTGQLVYAETVSVLDAIQRPASPAANTD